MGLPFIFPCTAIVVFSLAGMAVAGHTIGAESGAVAPAKNKEVPGLVGSPKQKERARRDAAEHAVKPDLQASDAQKKAERSHRAEASRRADAFLILLLVLRSPK